MWFEANAQSGQTDMYNLDSLRVIINSKEIEESDRVTNMLILSHFTMSFDTEEALKIAQEAKTISTRIDYTKGIAYSYAIIGNIYTTRSNFIEAIEVFKEGLTLDFAQQNEDYVMDIYNSLGSIYASIEDFEEAQFFFQKYYDYGKRTNQYHQQVVALNNLGFINIFLNQNNKALTFLRDALTASDSLFVIDMRPRIYANIGRAYININQLDSAKEALKAGLSIIGVNDAPMELAYLKAINANLHFKLKEFDKAEKICTEVLKMSAESGSTDQQAEMNSILSKIAASKGNYKQAFEYLKLENTWKDSVQSKEQSMAVLRNELKMRHDFESLLLETENQKQLSLKQAEIRKKEIINYTTTGGILFLLLFGSAAFMLYKKRREAQLNFEVAQTETKALRTQMNPHFIFNALNSVNNFITINQSEKASNYLMRFAQLMRMILENSEKKEIVLADDLKALEIYLQLEAERVEHPFEYSININSQLDAENIVVPALILQPFVENSIWHGIASKKDGKISINIDQKDDYLICQINDNGVGYQQKAKFISSNMHQSLGTKITNARIELLNILKKSKANIKYFNLEPGTRVEITLPLEFKF
jgi:two-component sensor histidine kinase